MILNKIDIIIEDGLEYACFITAYIDIWITLLRLGGQATIEQLSDYLFLERRDVMERIDYLKEKQVIKQIDNSILFDLDNKQIYIDFSFFFSDNLQEFEFRIF